MKNSTTLKSAIAGVTALVAVALAAPAGATPAVYTSRASFDAATTGQTTYGWPEYAGNDGGVDLGTSTVTKGGVTFETPIAHLFGYDDAYGAPYLGTIGSFTISTSASALGLYLGDFFTAQTVTYTFGSLTGLLSIPAADDTVFFGLTSDVGPISITFTNSDEIDVLSFITASLKGATSPVPEPMTLAIFGAGLLGAAAAMRRQKKV
jgi:hypothetical protein